MATPAKTTYSRSNRAQKASRSNEPRQHPDGSGRKQRKISYVVYESESDSSVYSGEPAPMDKRVQPGRNPDPRFGGNGLQNGQESYDKHAKHARLFGGQGGSFALPSPTWPGSQLPAQDAAAGAASGHERLMAMYGHYPVAPQAPLPTGYHFAPSAALDPYAAMLYGAYHGGQPLPSSGPSVPMFWHPAMMPQAMGVFPVTQTQTNPNINATVDTSDSRMQPPASTPPLQLSATALVAEPMMPSTGAANGSAPPAPESGAPLGLEPAAPRAVTDIEPANSTTIAALDVPIASAIASADTSEPKPAYASYADAIAHGRATKPSFVSGAPKSEWPRFLVDGLCANEANEGRHGKCPSCAGIGENRPCVHVTKLGKHGAWSAAFPAIWQRLDEHGYAARLVTGQDGDVYVLYWKINIASADEADLPKEPVNHTLPCGATLSGEHRKVMNADTFRCNRCRDAYRTTRVRSPDPKTIAHAQHFMCSAENKGAPPLAMLRFLARLFMGNFEVEVLFANGAWTVFYRWGLIE